jgi:AraC-like DNA-binding protein
MPEEALSLNSFLKELGSSNELFQAFEHIGDICMFIKDTKSRLISCNENMLRLFGKNTIQEIHGKTGFDFFPSDIASPFIEDDRKVLQSGKTLQDKIELNISENGTISWYSTTKIPLRNKLGDTIGLLGLTKKIKNADIELHPFRKMVGVINHLEKHYKDEVDIEHLANLSRLSKSQFHRSFKKLFRMTPLQFVLKIRLQSSLKLLKNTLLNISEVAFESGFNDQNYFARCFSKTFKCTPTEYRKKFESQN